MVVLYGGETQFLSLLSEAVTGQTVNGKLLAWCSLQMLPLLLGGEFFYFFFLRHLGNYINAILYEDSWLWGRLPYL